MENNIQNPSNLPSILLINYHLFDLDILIINHIESKYVKKDKNKSDKEKLVDRILESI